MRICSIEGCTRKHYSRSWCQLHYGRWYKFGDPLHEVREWYADPEEAFAARTEWQGDCLVWTGATNNDGYGYIWFQGKSTRVHRYAWFRSNGEIPLGLEIDHRCHNTLCVNDKHLRLATSSQNSMHRQGPTNQSSTGELNIYPHGARYRVQIKKNGVYHYFGYFDTMKEARPIRDKARLKLFGEFNRRSEDS